MKNLYKMIKISFVSGLLLASQMANAGTLENLERERAQLIETFLDANLDTSERLSKIENSKPRLIDLERMVLRDDKLSGRNTPAIRKAFGNYDLTFLVHASAEKNRTLFDLWLTQVGITTETIMVATKVAGPAN
jgi:hypothetical protein